MNKWTKELVIKAVVGAPFALAIGFLVKADKAACTRALNHFFPEEPKPDQED